MKNVFDELKTRGFIEQTNNEGGLKKLLEKPSTVYAGFDPSAPSLHIGSLTLVKAISLFQRYGHKVIFLVGGATGLIGDPTGKEKARRRLTSAEVKGNLLKIKTQVERLGLLKFSGKNAAIIVDNYRWQSRFLFIDDFMMKIAPSFSVNYMVKLKTFEKRLKDKQNLSLMEFCYPVLQAWDFLYLFKKYGCRIQIGGNDQWANILEGVGLVRRNEKKEVFAIAIPLLTTSSGKKMGKTERGTIWLDKDMTSPFQLYQEIEKTPDELIGQMFRRLTDLELLEIKKIMGLTPRERQKRLAFEITKTIHGEKEAQKAQRDSGRLFGKDKGATEGIPSFSVPKSGMELDEILVRSGISPSKSEVKRRCEAGAVRIEDRKISNPKTTIKKSCTIKFGKTDFLKIEVQNN